MQSLVAWWVQNVCRRHTCSDRGLSKDSFVNCLSRLKLSALIVVKQRLIPPGPLRPASLMKGALASLLLWKEKDAFSSLAVALHTSTGPPLNCHHMKDAGARPTKLTVKLNIYFQYLKTYILSSAVVVENIDFWNTSLPLESWPSSESIREA